MWQLALVKQCDRAAADQRRLRHHLAVGLSASPASVSTSDEGVADLLKCGCGSAVRVALVV